MSTRLRRCGLHVGRLLVAAERRFNDDLIGTLHAKGFDDIRPSHGAVFANVDAEGTRPSELARRAEMTKQAMGELIADLEAKGYVERRRDPRDGRASLVALTARGRLVDRAADRAIARIERIYARRLGRARFEALQALLEDLAALPPRAPRA
ncbi:MAG: MarR family transcriptional regulator [Actinomycetota bacterium]|nr:MarR family transcriptional regulator [Actinomycetota bacterium]